MKVSYVVTFDTPHAGTPTDEQIEHVRQLLHATVRKDTQASTHVTVTPLAGAAPALVNVPSFPTP